MLSSLRFRMVLKNKQSGAGNMPDANNKFKQNIKTARRGRLRRPSLIVWDTASHEYERNRVTVAAFSLFLLVAIAVSFDRCNFPSAPAVPAASN
jgi:hypothetical protein